MAGIEDYLDIPDILPEDTHNYNSGRRDTIITTANVNPRATTSEINTFFQRIRASIEDTLAEEPEEPVPEQRLDLDEPFSDKVKRTEHTVPRPRVEIETQPDYGPLSGLDPRDSVEAVGSSGKEEKKLDSTPPPDTQSQTLIDKLKERDLRFIKAFPIKANIRRNDIDDHWSLTYENLLCQNIRTGDYVHIASSSARDDFSKELLAFANAWHKAGLLDTDYDESIQPSESDPIRVGDNTLYPLEKTVGLDRSPELEGTPWIFLKELGGGGTADLYLTYNKIVSRLEVLKTAKRKQESSSDSPPVEEKGNPVSNSFEWMIENESRVLDDIGGSKGIVKKCCDTLLPDGRNALVTPYHYFTSHQLIEEAVREFKDGDKSALNRHLYNMFEGMIDALKTLHDNEYSYMDFKPENILWEWDAAENKYDARLIDFGTVLKYDDSRRWDAAMGTPSTIEPEQTFTTFYPWFFMTGYHNGDSSLLDKISRVDCEHQMDVYSLGKSCLELGNYALDILKHGVNEARMMAEHITDDYLDAINSGFGIVKLIELANKEIEAFEDKNIEAGDFTNGNSYPVFDDQIIDLVRNLVSVRTERPHIDEITVGITGGRNTFWDVEEYDLTAHEGPEPFRFKPDIHSEDASYDIARKLLDVIEHMESVYEGGNIYLDIEYKDSCVCLDRRMKHTDAKRHRTKRFNPNYVEEEALITFYSAYAAAAHAGNRELKTALRRSRRVDHEFESGVCSLGHILNEVMAESLGIELEKFNNGDWEDTETKFLQAIEKMNDPDYAGSKETLTYAAKRMTADGKDLDHVREHMKEKGLYDDKLFGIVEDISKYEIVTLLKRQHERNYENVKRSNERQELYDPRLVGLVDKMTRFRMDNRIDYSEVKEVLYDILNSPPHTPGTRMRNIFILGGDSSTGASGSSANAYHLPKGMDELVGPAIDRITS